VEAGTITVGDVRQAFGRVAERSQQYECGLATMALYLEYFAKGWWQKSPDHGEVAALKQTLDKTTLGGLLSKLRLLGRFEDDGSTNIDQSLKDALQVRNFLAHEFFLGDPEEMETQDGLHRKLVDLEKCEGIIDKAVGIVSMVVEGLVKLRDDLNDPGRREAIMN
jgi:hypothetical protein